MPDKHQRAVNTALDANERIGKLFDRIGHADAPAGGIYAAYRQARLSLDVTNIPRVLAVLRLLRQSVVSVADLALGRAYELGIDEAGRQLGVYNVRPMNDLAVDDGKAIVLAAVVAALDAQLNGINALLIAGEPDASLILGDDTRVGLLTPAPISAEITRWAAFLTGKVFARQVSASVDNGYVRQAVAAIDERTTDCCLHVNGHTATLEGSFELTGTPRFADRVHAPPFHWFCRTATALVRMSDADDELTRSMREAARSELRARQNGSRKEIHPAHSSSRR